MGRPIGVKNKAKLMAVPLRELNRVFLPDTMINISTQYADILNVTVVPQTPGVAGVAVFGEKEKVAVKDLSKFEIR